MAGFIYASAAMALSVLGKVNFLCFIPLTLIQVITGNDFGTSKRLATPYREIHGFFSNSRRRYPVGHSCVPVLLKYGRRIETMQFKMLYRRGNFLPLTRPHGEQWSLMAYSAKLHRTCSELNRPPVRNKNKRSRIARAIIPLPINPRVQS